MPDLFDTALEWRSDEHGGAHAKAADGRVITLEKSILTGRWVVTIPTRDGPTRRALVDIDAAKVAADRIVRETSP